MSEPNANRMYFDLDNGELRVWVDRETGASGWSPERSDVERVRATLCGELSKTNARANGLRLAIAGLSREPSTGTR